MPYDAGCKIISEKFHENGTRSYIKWDDGEEHYRNEFGQLHRLDGPAVILSEDQKYYYVNGKIFDVNSYDEFIIKLLLE